MKLILSAGLLSFTLLLMLSSCNDHSSEIDKITVQQEVKDTLSSADTLSLEEDKHDQPLEPVEFAKMIAEKIQTDSFQGWKTFSSNEVFFSPYAYVDTNTLAIVSAEDLSNLFSSDQKMMWGIQDGTGDSLQLNFSDYEQRYINDFDLMDTSIVKYSIVNNLKAYGNEVHNVHLIYPEALLVEAYKPAEGEMGMDWRSLIFVIEKRNGELELLGLVHNEWTI